jgi:hypothetical protein
MEIVQIPVKGQHPVERGVGQVVSIQVDVAKTFESRFTYFAADILEIKRCAQHLLTIPETRLARQQLQVLSIRVHIHIDRKT